MLHEAPYLAGLVLASLCAGLSAWLTGDRQLARSIAVIAANWLAGIAWNIATGHLHDWQFNIVLDSTTSVAILWRPAGRMQAILGVSYLVQVAMHIGFGAAKWFGLPDPDKYYAALTLVAWVQLLLIGGWCVAIWVGGLVHRRRDIRDPRAVQARGGYLAEP